MLLNIWMIHRRLFYLHHDYMDGLGVVTSSATKRVICWTYWWISNQIVLYTGIYVMYDWFKEHYCALIIVDVIFLAYLIGLDCVGLAGCRHLLVPQNSRQPWDLKWLKSMGTWAWALLMFLGGPNYCRVGRMGS